ncbi:hypothetical protein D1872_214200 [compost metagenome]
MVTEKQYGDWAKTIGRLEDFTDSELGEMKELMYIAATEDLKSIGVDINDQEIKWVVKQFDADHISIAWKTVVKQNG